MTSCNRYWRSPPRRGVTLVEVVAASTLMASLLTAIVMAYGAHQRQLRAAEARLNATAAADRLLAQWGPGAEGIPRNQSGVLGALDGRRWTTTTLNRHTIGSSTFDVVRLKLFPVGSVGTSTEPLVAVDVLVRVP